MIYPVGTRVVLKGHWEFPDGTIGTIAEPTDFLRELSGDDQWNDHVQTCWAKDKKILSYFVLFDEATDDGSGDGPYTGGVIDQGAIQVLDSNS